MSGPTIETDLGKILDQINQNLKETNQKLDALQKDVTEIRIVQVRFEAEVRIGALRRIINLGFLTGFVTDSTLYHPLLIPPAPLDKGGADRRGDPPCPP